MNRRLGCAFLVLATWLLAAPPARAVAPASSEAAEAADWAIVLREAAQYLQGGERTPGLTRGHLSLVRRIRSRANDAKARLREELRLSGKLLGALGPPPSEGGAPEAREIAGKRERYGRRIAAARGRVAEADLAIVRAGELEEALSAARREQLLEDIYRRAPIPVSPGVIIKGAPELTAALGRVLRSPLDWGAGLPAGAAASELLPGVVVLILGAALGWGIRRSALDLFGRDPGVSEPAYASRLGAALAQGAGGAARPGAALAALYLWTTRPGALASGLFAEAFASFLVSALLFCLAAAFARALLAPDQPAWRLTAQSPESARSAHRLILVLAAVFFIDMFFSSLGIGKEGSAESGALYGAAFGALEGWLLIRLGRAELWRAEGAAEGEAPPESRAWRLARRAARILAALGVAALLAGYVAFGKRLLDNLVLTSLLVALLALLRELAREAASWAARSGFVREKLHVPPRAMEALRSWERALVAPLVLAAGVLVILPVWGVPRDDLVRWILHGLSGFHVGSIRVSVVDIASAILVFFLAMAGARFLQRQLSERLLGQMRLPPGIRDSLNAGLGYAGVILAALLSVSVTGIDLSNLALLASALSVGIGFGLQNVVNNFVSGLILLVERPIKIGDWVRVGDSEGIVKRIQFRATELETWRRASVIIPNAEILSTSVVNLTHRDDYGRAEVEIGAAYGSDAAKVREILLDAAAGNERVSERPAPWVAFRDFGASSLDFKLYCYTSNVMGRLQVESDLRFEIERRFREEGIEIPFPQRVVHLASPEEGGREEGV